MNKPAKIISAILTFVIALSLSATVVMSSLAADKPVFTLEKVSEDNTTFVVSINLESGHFNNASFQIITSENLTACARITKGTALKNAIMDLDAISASNANKSKANIASSRELSETGVYFIFTYLKADGANISAKDFTLIENDIEAEVKNNIDNFVVETTTKSPETTTRAIVEETTTAIPVETTTEAIDEETTTAIPVETTTEFVEETTKPIQIDNSCGDNLTWKFDSATGTLFINGTGDMYSYSASSYRISYWNYYGYKTTAPWKIYFNQIKEVVISKDVTSIGDYAFYGCFNIESIEIPNSTSIGSNAFYCCNNINTITITKGSNEAVNYGTSYRDNCYYDTPWHLNQNATVIIESDVDTIGDFMFYDCKISSIKLPNQLKYIGVAAFDCCHNLQDITIPDNVENIGDRAFAYCENLKNVNLGNSESLTLSYDVFNGCVSIGNISIGSANVNYCTDENGVLYNKNKSGLIKYATGSSLTTYTVDSNTAYINEYAFEGSANLESINLPENMMSIGAYAFKDCTALKEAIVPEGLYTLCYAAFDGCTGLEKVVLPESLKTLGGHSFRNCTNLKEVIFNCKNCNYINNGYSPFEGAGSEADKFSLIFTDSVVSIPDNLFYNYFWYDDYRNDDFLNKSYYVTEISIGKNVKNCGTQSFLYLPHLTKLKYFATNCDCISFIYCKNLTEIEIGENVKTIPSRFVYDCISVNSIEIPESVTRIGSFAFYGTEIYNDKDNWTGSTLFIGNNLICVDEKTDGEYIVPDNVRVIADRAFADSKITKVTIPQNVISVGNWTFNGCEELKTVNFNCTDCCFGKYAFANSSVKEFNIGNKVKTLPAYLLADCDFIKSVTIPQSVEYIGEEIFGYGTLLKIKFESTDKITFGGPMFCNTNNSQTVIYCKQNSFIHSYSVMKVLPLCLYNDNDDSLFKIENQVLENYTGTTEKVFINFVSQIGYGAFENNKTIKSVELSNSVTALYNAVFKNCTNLEKIIIPQSVASIGDNAFEGCDKLTIWCYAGSYAEAYATNHGIPIKYITLQLDNDTLELQTNDSAELCASFNADLSDKGELIWSSNNPNVITVTNDGKITAVGAGKATITATSSTGLYATCLVKVSENVPQPQPKVNSVQIDDISLNYKKSTTLTPKIDADSSVTYTVEYESSNPKVATVDENGKVTATKCGSGSATITCTVTDQYGNTVTDDCKVNVSLSFGQKLLVYVLFGWIWY